MAELESMCPVCGKRCSLLDVVDFNKSCEEPKGKFLPLSGLPVYYSLCSGCGFCYSPDLCQWDLDEFEELIYNEDYIQVDPNYLELRPNANASFLFSTFPKLTADCRHLDFGGGNGELVKRLRQANWNSMSYDPFVDRNTDVAQLGKFDLITAFEVFEHVPSVPQLMTALRALLNDCGMVLFTTLLSDGNLIPNQRINWWYAAPRNGHISLFSRRSLVMLAQQHGFSFHSFGPNTHAFVAMAPSWASHLIRTLA